MELKLNVSYNELLDLIKQLPAEQRIKLKAELEEKISEEEKETKPSDFQKFLLTGPVMSDEQYKAYLENRKDFSEWRRN